jgi:FAD/FMN-containing dehydrogenase
MLDEATTTTFGQSLRGPLVRDSDSNYDEVRKLYNAMIDKRPLMIARCADVADVIAAVNFGRENKLPIAIRGGGHNGPGFGSVDNGLVIDLSAMRGVRVDPKAETVRVGPGCTTGDVDHATSAFGQAVPFGIISTTGVAGLTLSGGHGYLSRQYGLAVDNLLAADVVLADGRFVTASKDENADLLWALQGGGGNFGVVTSFLFRTHPAKLLFGGPAVFAIEDAEAVMRWYRDFMGNSADNFFVWLGLQSIPSGEPFPREHWGKKVCVLLFAHNGEGGEAAVKAELAKLPEPLINWTGPIPYPALQSMFDALYPTGMHWYWKGDFVRDLSDEAIARHIEHASKSPSETSGMHLYPIDGAVHRRQKDETAWNTRDANWSMVIIGVDTDAAKMPKVRQWAHDYWEAVHPYNLGGAYPNFMMDDEGESRLRATYGDNYERLRKIKGKYDPDNLFRVNHNIRPAA